MHLRHRTIRILLWPLAVFGVSATGPQAQAQPQASGFAAQRLQPAAPGSDFFSGESLDFRGVARPAFGLTLDWGHKPVVLYDDRDQSIAPLVNHAIYAHLGGQIVLSERVRLGLGVPVALLQSGQAGRVETGQFSAASGAGFGDLRFSADVRVFGEPSGGIRAAVGAGLFVPTGSKSDYTGDGGFRFQPRVMLAGQTDAVSWAARLGAHLRPQPKDYPSVGTEIDLGLAAGARLLQGRLVVGPELMVAGGTREAFLSSKTTALELLLGAHFAATDAWHVGFGGGPGVTRAPGSPAFRLMGDVAWVGDPAPPDGDADGIADKDDACPMVPGARTGDPRTHGCPPPPDTDRDGVVDADDACPRVAGLRTTDSRTNGCPPPPAPPPPPPPPPPDADHDLIIDAEDACPQDPGVRTGKPSTNGCPLPKDGDGDGVVDNEDACPAAPGARDLDPKKNGCPVARLEAQRIVIRDQVKFATGNAKILPESEGIIRAVADILQANVQIKQLRVEGHTDNVGRPAANLRLSRSRAAAVVKALVVSGIDRRRMKSAGFGQQKPIDNNLTDNGRGNNRRVEFHIENDLSVPGSGGVR